MKKMKEIRPEAYLFSVEYYEWLISSIEDILEDIEDAKLVRERANGPYVVVNLWPKRHTAAELNAQSDLKAPMPIELLDWENAPAAGSESL